MSKRKMLLVGMVFTTMASMAFTALTSHRKKRLPTKPYPDESNDYMPANYIPSPNAYFASFDGWRRAKANEVTPLMREDAKLALQHPLKAIVDRSTYRIALETHWNETKGEHKGATIFVRKGVEA